VRRTATLPPCAQTIHSTFSLYSTAPALTELYTLSLHDALPISDELSEVREGHPLHAVLDPLRELLVSIADESQHITIVTDADGRSEEHTSELQSRENLVCRLLLEKKKHGGDRTRIVQFDIKQQK